MDESSPEEVLLDENVEAAKSEFYMVGGFEVSPNHRCEWQAPAACCDALACSGAPAQSSVAFAC